MMDRSALQCSACHKEQSLIFSVPHAVLDYKMATAAILTVLMWKHDAGIFIYCHCTACRVPHSHLLQPQRRKQPLTFSYRDVLLQHRSHVFGDMYLNNHASVFHVLDH